MPDADAPPKYHVIVNPIAGTGSAPKFINDHVCSLLERLGIQADVHVTESVKDAGRIGRDIVLERIDAPPQDGVTRVVVGGGDGTAHEFIEGVLAAVEEKGVPLGKWALVTLPLGTANALHSTHFPPDAAPLPIPTSLAPAVGDISPEVHQALSSLFLALDGAPARPLPITLTSLVRADGSVSEVVPDHIVLSTALHAAILSDSDALRAEHPGLERYKLAAAANIAEFFPADVELVPDSERGVRQYDPRTRTWVAPYSADSETGGRVRLNGPFTYFLTTNSTARLEPTFVIAPTLASLPREDGERTTDIVILRPLRDPAVRKAIDDGGDGGAQWVARAKEVLGGAYQDGRHVQFTYAGPGPVEDAGPGDVVVETFRAAGFTWRPTDDSHAKSHIVCADGSLYDIEVGGEARAHVLGSEAADGASADRGFWVWG